MKIRKWMIAIFLLLIVTAVPIAFAKLTANDASKMPDSPELYADFIGEHFYSTVSFDHRGNQDVPICFLIDFYDFLHDEFDDGVLTWRINDSGVGQQSYVYAYPGSLFGRWSLHSRRQISFIKAYKPPIKCDRSIDELNELFPVINVHSDPSNLSPVDYQNQ